MKKFSQTLKLLLLYISLVCLSFGQNQVWRQWYDRNGCMDLGLGLAIDKEQNIVVCGIAGFPWGNDHGDSILILKFSPEGTLIWSRTWGYTDSSKCGGGDIVIDNQNNIFVCGTKSVIGSTNNEMVILKYDSQGSLIWEKNFSLPGSTDCGAEGIVLDNSGNIIVTGWDYVETAGGVRFLTVKIDSLGNIIWTKTYGYPGSAGFDEGSGNKCVVDTQGNTYIAGWFFWTDDSTQPIKFWTGYLILKYNSMGTLLWDKYIRYSDSIPHDWDGAFAITLDSSGNPIVTGLFNDHARTIKMSPNGTILWNHTFEEVSGGYGICVDKAGNVIVVGTRGMYMPDFILTYDSLGNLLSAYNPPLPRTVCYDVAPDSSQCFYAVGGNIDEQNPDLMLDKYRCYVGVDDLAGLTQEKMGTLQIRPNPFINKTEIKFLIPEKTISNVGTGFASGSLKIYDATGRLVKQFNHLTNYQSSITWDGTDDSGRKLPSGVYFIRLESNEFKETEKVILLR